MTRKIATALQSLGILSIAAGVGLFSIAAGIITLGIGAVLFGVALEWTPTAAKDPADGHFYSPNDGREI